ncbi:hypothetical protein BpHYR1_006111 [Brachionus plicatilis]|uniref:DNA helicase n=1 Tax=Brachionus plicatilis TaxID=10195 RepID=A0A3M7PDW6_BRAPC|nr:hypothetical protein BpHYR1_006111 [Brachionus plicatilis]
MPGKLIENRAIDLAMGKKKNTNKAKNLVASLRNEMDLNKTCGMRSLLRLKFNCKYMISTNLRTEDGLVNGGVDCLKHIVYTKNKTNDKPLNFLKKNRKLECSKR